MCKIASASAMKVSWYSRVLARYPYIVLVTTFALSLTCLIVPFITRKIPDFGDPQLGFEARGTPLAQRLTAWRNLREESMPRGNLVNNPLEYYYFLQETHRQNKNALRIRENQTAFRNNRRKNKKNRKSKKEIEVTTLRRFERSQKYPTSDFEPYEDDSLIISDKQYKSEAAGTFCNTPSSAYARVVISSDSPDHSLWSLDGILAQCHIDAALRANPHFSPLCQRQLGHENKCCKSWFPANYVALMSNRTSCLSVTESDLRKVEQILKRCLYYYANFELTPDCSEDLKCQNKVPTECYLYNAPFNLLHYHLDIDFLSNKTTNGDSKILRNVMLILPLAASSASMDFYNSLNLELLRYRGFHVSGMQLGLKSTLFDYLLLVDSRLLLFGACFVTLCIWSYTGSFLITLATVLTVIFSLGISYTVYTMVLRIHLFPFMNLLAVVVAVGIGADDAFIFCKVWECNKRKKPLNSGRVLSKLIHETLRHAVPAMFVTSLTTAIAFFASIVSSVTAINCFSVFSGVTVVANFLLMVTWFPACVVIVEQIGLSCFSPANVIFRKIIRPLRQSIDNTAHAFNKFLIRLVTSLKWLWFSTFSIVALGGCFIVFYYPGLQLPDSPDFQLFHSSHIFEQYDLYYSKKFRFERLEQSNGDEILPMRFVWGILPEDNGDYFDPTSKGHLVYDKTFNVSSQESQIWLQQFCRDLRQQRFYRSTLGPLLPNCFIESLQPWMERPCEDPVDPKINHYPCCQKNPFPYQPNVLENCVAQAIAEIHRTPSHLWNYGAAQTAGLRFQKEDHSYLERIIANDNGNAHYNNFNSSEVSLEFIPKIQVVVIEYDSTYSYSLSYVEMNKFFNEVETWMKQKMQTAPLGMKNGWFVSHLEFYELQRTLHQGTVGAIAVSIGLALGIVALVTFNPIISFYAILSVSSAIIVSVAILIVIGWKLNVLESVAVSTAIGLSVDFSLHYGMSYRANYVENNVERVKLVIQQMGGPTLMAALTSGAAGALMLPSTVLAYIQISIFLVIIMSVSWIYATFFLCPLIAASGPLTYFSRFYRPRLCEGAENEATDVDIGNPKSGLPQSNSMGTSSSTICQLQCIENSSNDGYY